jgi:hypothetical protein
MNAVNSFLKIIKLKFTIPLKSTILISKTSKILKIINGNMCMSSETYLKK